MFKSSKIISNRLKYVNLVSNVARYGSDKVQICDLKSFEEIPGPRSYPIIGTLHKYAPFIGFSGDYDVEKLDQNAWLNYRRYGSLVRETPGVNVLHVYDPEDIETVFRQDHRFPARRSHIAMYHYRMNKPDVYKTGGLLSTYAQNGEEWWRLRSTFQKNFTSPKSVKSHIESTEIVIREFINWIKERNVSHNEDFLPYLNRWNLEYHFPVIGIVAFNERFRSFSPEEQDPTSRSSRTIDAAFGSNSGIMKLDKGFMWKIFETPVYKRLADSQTYLEKWQLFNYLPIFYRVSKDILYNRIHYFEQPENGDVSLLGSFLKQPNVDLKDVIGVMVDILMAAIDTVNINNAYSIMHTAYSTSFALYHIGRNPEVQQKMFEEICTLLPTKDTNITADILSKATYVRACIKESLRLNPVSVGIGRLTQKDFVLRGYLIPKGVSMKRIGYKH
uniref:SFRICE011718.2 n=1 Tax=Spodoptera frugiperda TaxID=7108 RepID=A0A2H1VDT0_SPOFR